MGRADRKIFLHLLVTDQTTNYLQVSNPGEYSVHCIPDFIRENAPAAASKGKKNERAVSAPPQQGPVQIVLSRDMFSGVDEERPPNPTRPIMQTVIPQTCGGTHTFPRISTFLRELDDQHVGEDSRDYRSLERTLCTKLDYIYIDEVVDAALTVNIPGGAGKWIQDEFAGVSEEITVGQARRLFKFMENRVKAIRERH